MSTREYLEKGELLRISAEAGSTIRVHSGNVWLTQDDGKDYVLGPGESVVASGAQVLINAFHPSMLELYRADPAGLRARVEKSARFARARAFAALFRRMFA